MMFWGKDYQFERDHRGAGKETCAREEIVSNTRVDGAA
jgi:hypothetical protein